MTSSASAPAPMLLSVVVVNWNSKGDLEKCLRALAEQSHASLEVIVVDNGSTDGSVEMMRSEFPQVTCLPQSENLGFAQACNIGIEASNGAWVCMLNNDTVADPQWAEALVSAVAVADDRCGMLQSLMLYEAERDMINSTGIELTRRGSGRDRFDKSMRSRGGDAAEIFCPTAGAAAYRRAMLNELKIDGDYFDRRHFMYYEDMDLGWRARLAGWSAQYVPGSLVYHVWHGSSRRHDVSWLRCMTRTNRIRTMVKNGSWQMLARNWHVGVGVFCEVTWRGGIGGTRDLVRATGEAWRSRRQVEAMRQRSRIAVERRWQQA